MGIEENKKVLRRYIDELMNARDYSKADEILHKDFVAVGGGGAKGADGHKRYTDTWRATSSDLHLEVQQMIAEDDMIAVFVQWTGTHDGAGIGVPPTGKHFSFGNVAVYQFKEGKIINGAVRTMNNWLSNYQQLGILPPNQEIFKAYNDSLKQMSKDEG